VRRRGRATPARTGEFPERKRRQTRRACAERILKSIEDGDVDRVQRQARVHLESSLLYAVADTDKPVEASSPRQAWTTRA